jgi:flagellar hook-basal body complex protein FliE
MIDPLNVASLASNFISKVGASPQVDTSSFIQKAGADFAAVLNEGEKAAVQGMTGEMPMQQAVEKILEAERTLQTVVAVRDKIVSAYLEISRMQI